MNDEQLTQQAIQDGRPVMIFHIGTIGQMNPSATVVHNTYYGDQFVPQPTQPDGQPAGQAADGQPAAQASDSQPVAQAAEPVAKARQSAPKVPKALQKQYNRLREERQRAASQKPRELMTFRKRGILDAHLQLLYTQLVADGWIAPETRADHFLDLFSGERSEATIIWAGKYGKGTLVYFFRHLEVEGVIEVPQGFSVPNILMGHLTDAEGHYLIGLDKGDACNDKAVPEILHYVELLKQHASSMGRRPARHDHAAPYLYDEESPLYDDALNPYDPEGLRIKQR